MRETIRHQGVVEHIEATTCTVRIMQQAACGGCAVKHLCKSSESKEKIVEASIVSEPVHVGQMVMVEGALSQGFLAVWIAYVVPLLLMVVVLFLGCMIWGEVAGASLALLLLAIYYGILYLLRDRMNRRFYFVVRPLEGATEVQ